MTAAAFLPIECWPRVGERLLLQVQMANVARSFAPSSFSPPDALLMHCIQCMRALRPRAWLLHKYALQVCITTHSKYALLGVITQVCTPSMHYTSMHYYPLAGLHLSRPHWGLQWGCTGWQLGEVWAADSIRSSGMPPSSSEQQ